MFSILRFVCLLLCSLMVAPAFASTWYVRTDGGTRYSSNMPKGQCDGTADAPYSGHGTNQHCAFNDVRYLIQDGAYPSKMQPPSWGWIGKGGDSYIIRGSMAEGISYRVGWNNPKNSYDANQYWGIPGDPFNSGMPPPPSGTPEQHTRILGGNYESCHAATAKTQIHGGYGVYAVFSMKGSSYVDIACLDITDRSPCGRSSQPTGCVTSGPALSDFANTGITWSNKSTHDTVQDVRIHGLAQAGMGGPTGDGAVFRYLDLIGNASSGWNADPNDGTTGNGTLLVEHYNISWNGCTEEYPIKDPLPYHECTDQNSGGYGDGFGTTTAESNPSWKVTFDQGTVSYNTQDGLDALHIAGGDSMMTVTHTLAFGNMGQQIKVGGAAGVITDNQIVTNCNAMRQAIPGTPHDYNVRLSDFCRAADTGVLMTVNDTVPSKFIRNVVYSASATGVEVECVTKSCGSAAKIEFRDNIFLGFKNDTAHGYPGGGRGEYSNPIYIGPEVNPFKNPGSIYTGNTTFHPSATWHCPAAGEKNAHCGDPHLVDETWHNYGYGDMSAAKPGAASTREPGEPDTSILAAHEVPAAIHKRVRLRTLAACVCVGVLGVAVLRGVRSRQNT